MSLKQMRRRALAGAPLFGLASECLAHGFGQRYDLPLPLWLWVVGAGATIVVTFVLVALFLRSDPRAQAYPRIDLLRWRLPRLLTSTPATTLLQILGVAGFAVTICAGLFGVADPYRNLVPTMIWVIWWVGLAFVCALAGNIWPVLNPIRTLFCWAECGYARLSAGRSLSLTRNYPAGLGAWPAVAVLFAFGWAELVWLDGDVPFALAGAALCYTVWSWFGMFVFGREVWLRNGEAFSIVFEIFGRFAPLGYQPAERPGANASFYLRPPAMGLVDAKTVTPSLVMFVLLMLATVAFDGLTETPQFLEFLNLLLSLPVISPLLWWLRDLGVSEFQSLMTALMLLLPLLFLAVYLTCCASMSALVRRRRAQSGQTPAETAGGVACAFVLTLIPIAIAYHLAHYIGMLFTSGQHVIPLLSDPLGLGWDLFGTASYEVDIGLIGARFVWYAAVIAIVVGHVLSVYIAHLVAMRRYGEPGTALVSQIPMVVLMVVYTCLSLWILAQPISG